MALGAAATGARAATGSTGQGISLMQETIAEAALNELPVVFFNVARGQQDYFQATRGGGWGDYRTIALAPASVVEAAELTTLAFELADQWLTPVHVLRRPHDRLHADDDRAATGRRGEAAARRSRGPSTAAAAAPAARRSIWTWRQGKHNTPGPGPTATGRASPRSTTRSRSARPVTSRATSTTPRSWSCRSAPPARSSTTWSTSCAPTATASARSGRSRSGRSRATRSPTVARGRRLQAGARARAQRRADDRRRAPGGGGRGARCAPSAA